MRLLVFLVGLAFSATSYANHFGVYAGSNIPYLVEGGLAYHHKSNKFGVDVSYGNFDISSGEVGVGLTKYEATARYHPFSKSLYLGLGIGQQSLYAKSTDIIQGQSITAEAKIEAIAITPKLGWMFGIAGGGFFGGLEFGYQMPQNPKGELTSNAPFAVRGTADYRKLEDDINKQAEAYGEVSIPVVTYIRLGYLF